MDTERYWYILFAILLLGYIAIQFSVKDKKRYFIYFISAMILGFLYDIISFSQGYYSYPDFYRLTILGLPVTMTLAEGFSVVICFYLIELIRKRVSQ
jgi:hypothetical protein